MTDPLAQKNLSFSAIVILAANTMNGPGLTTLPDVATNAGLFLFVVLIALSVSMTSFVCRRMVFAMWSSLTEFVKSEEEGLLDYHDDGHGNLNATTITAMEGGGGEQQQHQHHVLYYGGMKSLRISDGSNIVEESFGLENNDNEATTAAAAEAAAITTSLATDELIPKASSPSDQLIHHIVHSQDEENTNNNNIHIQDSEKDDPNNTTTTTTPTTTTPNLLLGHKQPLLERTSIVGQSREAYGQLIGTNVAFTMVASALCLALAQMMLCAAIMDGMFVALGGKSCAIGLGTSSLSPTTVSSSSSSSSSSLSGSFIHCTEHLSMKPFMNSGAPVSIVSIGWLVAAGITVALGTVDLDEMMGAQYALFGCLLISCARFAYVLHNMRSNIDVGEDNILDAGEGEEYEEEEQKIINPLSWFIGPSAFQAVGPIMFNFAFVVTAPPLSAMAKKESIAYKALAVACIVMGILYACVGWVGAPVANAVKNGLIDGGDDTNLLSLILLGSGGGSEGEGASFLDLLCIASFGLSQLAAVPVYCLLAQETLINDAGIPKLPAFLLSNVLPWILVALTYNAAFFEAFVNWSGLLILGYANFSLPLLLDMRLKAVREFRARSHKKSHGGGGIGDGEMATKITGIVFSVVTASISAVIAMSIAGSVVLSGMLFVSCLALTQFWPSASLI